MSKFNRILDKLLSASGFPEDAFYIQKTFHDRKIIVYGAGESFHYFKEVAIKQYGYMPSIVLDQKFNPGDTFKGIPAFPPNAYQPSVDEQRNAIVVICLGNQSYFNDVVSTLREMGFANIISLLDIYEIHNAFSLPKALETEGFGYYLKHNDQIKYCMNILADDLSKDVYTHCLKTHLERKPVSVPMSARHEQYTPIGIPLSRGFVRFIYCGVDIGEMRDIFSRTGSVEELVCFEPDHNQFKIATDYLAEHHADFAKRVTAFPCAAYSREGIEPFFYNGPETGFGSRILATGMMRCQAVTIDRVVPGFKPTYIIMDIEGAELDALKGAEQTIRNSMPDLAICVYHSPSHLWEIPLYIHSLGLCYRFYLRNYTSFIGETVLYAVSDISLRR